MRLAFTIVLAALFSLGGSPARAFSDAELIHGFNRTVFGSEFPSWRASVVKKFTVPVRFHVDDRTGGGRRAAAIRFIRTLPRLIRGLEVALTRDPSQANFRVFIVTRAQYRAVVASEVYGRPTSSFAPGKCMVRLVSGRNGISRSDAVIVADQGEFLFQRCLVEEILQGLGPANDDDSLTASVFNDRSPHASFTSFDRHILNMLYHPRVRAGARRAELDPILSRLAAEVRARLARSRFR